MGKFLSPCVSCALHLETPISVPYNACRTGCISWISEYRALASTLDQLLGFKALNEVEMKERNPPEEHTKSDKKEQKQFAQFVP